MSTIMMSVFAIIFLASKWVKILPEYERAVIYQLGRLIEKPRGPRLVFVFWPFEKAVIVSLRVVTLDVPPQDIITKDNVSAKVNAVIFFRVMDPNKAINEIQDYQYATSQMAQTTLRSVLGDHVGQRGSNINDKRLRLDFTHPEKMTDEEKEKVENWVNDAISQELPVSFSEMSVDEAKEKGAIGIFDDKYGDKVKVYQIGNKEGNVSLEICGGPHVENTGTLGKFKIKKEESVSQGVRRIKATLD